MRGNKKRRGSRRGSGATCIVRVPTNVLRHSHSVKHWWILRPDSTWRAVWSVFGDCMVLWSVVTTFYFLALSGPNTTGEVLDTCVWAFFVLDFIFNCVTLVYDHKGRAIYSQRYIILNYLRGGMLWDMVPLLPLRFAGYAEVEYYLRVLRLRQVPDVLNFVDGTGIGVIITPLVNISRSGDTKDIGLTSKLIGSSFQLLFGIVLGTYILGCFWLWYAEKVNNLSAEVEGSFMDLQDVSERSDFEKLERAWYFMMTTLCTIGYGDYLALNPYERVCMICLQFVGIAAFSMTIGRINSMINEYNSLTTPPDITGEMTLWLDSLEERYTKVPVSLRLRIMKHFSHYQRSDRLKSLALSWWQADSLDALTQPSDPYLSGLDSRTVTSVFSYLLDDVFAKYKLFFNINQEFKYAVAMHLQPRFFLPDEELIGEDEVPEEVYFLVAGVVTCGLYEGNQYTPYLTYSRRAIIGEYSALTNSPSPVVFMCGKTNTAEMLALPVKPLQDLLDHRFIHVKVKLLKLAMEKMAFMRSIVSSRVTREHTQGGFNLMRLLAFSPHIAGPCPPQKKLKVLVRTTQAAKLKRTIAHVEQLIESSRTQRHKFHSRRKALLRRLVIALDQRVEKKFCVGSG